jgi:hypothetical protein
MIDADTFLTILYGVVDDLGKAHVSPEPPHPSPAAALSRSEVVTRRVPAASDP